MMSLPKRSLGTADLQVTPVGGLAEPLTCV